MAETLQEFKAALSGRYTLERELGRGGMATVYLASDLRHKRQVALKLLDPEVGALLGAGRFLREIETAAQLQHPHILPVFDSGETAGQLWYTMPYVAGESLRGRLTREGQLPMPEALRLGREIADALDAAHQHGIVHRDIKPENILLSHGHALVADFGIARTLRPGDPRLTGTGLSVGTPAYMSPEQALGDPNLDGRSDVYALACVIYELLTGAPPYHASTAQGLIAAHVGAPIPDVRARRPEVVGSVAAALRRALAKDPAHRPATAATFAAELAADAGASDSYSRGTAAGTAQTLPISHVRRRPLLFGLLLLAALVVIGAFGRTHGPLGSAGGLHRLAVLPFETIGDTANAYFADGLAGELRGRLASLPALQVIGTTSSNSYRQTTKPPQAIARELGVQYLLVGQVQWDRDTSEGGHLRVRPELIEAATGATRWGQPFDAPARDLFRVQSDIAGRVATALGVALGATERASLMTGAPRSPAAYEAYLRAKAADTEQSSTGAEGTAARVRADAREALTYDSLYAPAWALLSRGYGDACLGLPCVYADSAKMAASRAIALAPDLPDGYLALIRYTYGVANQIDEAIRVAEAGLRHVPNNPELLANLSWALMARGDWARALETIEQAESLEPRSPRVLYSHARLLAYLRRWDDLRAISARGRAVDPRNAHFVAWPMIAALANGDSALARRVFEEGSPGLDMATLARSLVLYFDEMLVWVMPERARQSLLAESRPIEDDAQLDWARGRSAVYRLRGDTMRARIYSDSALRALDRVMPSPDSPVSYAILALVAADAHDTARARRALVEARKPGRQPDAMFDVVAEDLSALTLLRLGDRDAALTRWQPLLQHPYWLTPAWLRIAPEYAPLRAHPKFMTLTGAASQNP